MKPAPNSNDKFIKLNSFLLGVIAVFLTVGFFKNTPTLVSREIPAKRIKQFAKKTTKVPQQAKNQNRFRLYEGTNQ